MGLNPGMRVLDVGCGVGGPQGSIAIEFGPAIVGLNISEYQLTKCGAYNRKSGLDYLCSVRAGDFMDIPAEDESFDVAFHIEAIPYAPNETAACAEILRVLRPGAVFAGYDRCMTSLYDAANPDDRELRQRIAFGNALPRIATVAEVTDSLRAAGFEILKTHDRASDSDPATPWYQRLEGGSLTLRSLPRTALGRKLTTVALRILKGVRAVPGGSVKTQNIFDPAADSLVAAKRLGIFKPMYYHKARKPARA